MLTCGLQVDDAAPRLAKDVMAAANLHFEPKPLEQHAEVVKTNVRVRLAA